MRILCIGDSNTWGYNPKNGQRLERRWTRLLGEMLPEDEIVEEGLCGRTLISMDREKRERCGIDSLNVLLMSHMPVDLVLVMLGTNELKTVFHTNARFIARGVREFIRTIKNPFLWEKAYIPRVLVISPILLRDDIREREEFYTGFDENSIEQSGHMAEEIGKVCETYGVDFMNAADYAKASGIDGIHMDEENHRKLAEAICRKINELYKA